MKLPFKSKLAALSATSMLTAAAILAPQTAFSADAVQAAPTEQATVSGAALVAEAEQARAKPLSKPAQRAAMIAVALGALGWLVKLLGPKKVLRAVEKTAEATVKASAEAAKTAARAVRSPLRYLGWVAGLVLFALTGVGLYDIEWIGGLIAGAALAGLAAFGVRSAQAQFSLKPVPVKPKRASTVYGERKIYQ